MGEKRPRWSKKGDKFTLIIVGNKFPRTCPKCGQKGVGRFYLDKKVTIPYSVEKDGSLDSVLPSRDIMDSSWPEEPISRFECMECDFEWAYDKDHCIKV